MKLFRSGRPPTVIDALSLVLLASVMSLVAIEWTPVFNRDTLFLLKTALIIMFVSVVSLRLTQVSKIPVLVDESLTIPILLSLLVISRLGPETLLLYICFGVVAFMYFNYHPNSFYYLIIIYVFIIVLQSLYALITTLSPIAPIQPSFSSVHMSLLTPGNVGVFALQSGTQITILIATAAILILPIVIGKIREGSSLPIQLIWGLIPIILISHLLLVIRVTDGHGRLGLLLFLVGSFLTYLLFTGFGNVLPILVFTPILFWTSIYILFNIAKQQGIRIILDLAQTFHVFTSGRVGLYFGSIDMVVKYPHGIGISNFRGYFLWDKHFLETGAIRPHNFLLHYMIEMGIVVGVLILLWVWKLMRMISINDSSKSFVRISAVTLVSSYLFVGLMFGKTSPFMSPFSAIIWWVCFSWLASREI